MPTQPLPELLQRLTEEGYTDVCRAEEDGLHFLHNHAVYPAEDLKVEQVFRLEGTSAPDEQVVVFALSSPDGKCKATFSSPHGLDTDPLDADAIQRLSMVPPEERGATHQRASLQPQY